MAYNKLWLLELFRSRALKFGEFTLASGKKASYYLDGKQITLHSEGLRLVCEGFLELIQGVKFDAVGGMSIGADPMVGGMLTLAAGQGKEMTGFLVRKEPKGHGTGRYIEGPVVPGMTAVIVEDVVTTGGSSIQAAIRARDFGLKVDRVIAIIDRMEGGGANLAKEGMEFTSLLSISDFGISPPA